MSPEAIDNKVKSIGWDFWKYGQKKAIFFLPSVVMFRYFLTRMEMGHGNSRAVLSLLSVLSWEEGPEACCRWLSSCRGCHGLLRRESVPYLNQHSLLWKLTCFWICFQVNLEKCNPHFVMTSPSIKWGTKRKLSNAPFPVSFLFGLAHQDVLNINWREQKGSGNDLNTALTYEILRKITK